MGLVNRKYFWNVVLETGSILSPPDSDLSGFLYLLVSLSVFFLRELPLGPLASKTTAYLCNSFLKFYINFNFARFSPYVILCKHLITNRKRL